jgi:hypothetical protein
VSTLLSRLSCFDARSAQRYAWFTIFLTPLFTDWKSRPEVQMEVPISSTREPMSGASRCRTARFLIIAAEPPRIFILFVLPTRVEGPTMSKFPRTACCLVLLCAGWNAAFGQLSTATVFGNVIDASGAAIPNATGVLIQTQTNLTRTTTTNGQGEYHAGFLPVGPYTTKVDETGFKEVMQSGIVLSVTQQAALNFSLQPGAQNTVVNVTSQAPLINLGNSVLGRTVDNREIENLLLVGRDVYQLLNLTPGVQNLQNENSIGVPMEHVIINGSGDNMVGQATYYLDGGINMTGVRATGNVTPNPDAVDQFNVQTNNFTVRSSSFIRRRTSMPTVIFRQQGRRNTSTVSLLRSAVLSRRTRYFSLAAMAVCGKSLCKTSTQSFRMHCSAQAIFLKTSRRPPPPRAWDDVPRNCLPLIVRIRTTAGSSLSATL